MNLAGPNGQDVLRLAITNRHYTLAATLLDAGARPVTKDRQGRTPLHELITSRAPQRRLDAPDEGDSPQLSSLELMKQLVARGADPNARTEPTPVVHERWTDKGIYSAARPFMDNGVNLGGATPYLLAAQAADVEGMRLLQTLSESLARVVMGETPAADLDPRLRSFGRVAALPSRQRCATLAWEALAEALA